MWPRAKVAVNWSLSRSSHRSPPNVTPEEMLRGGAFGGTAFRDYYSRVLQRPINVEAELKELPQEWLAGLDVDDMLRRDDLDPSRNKFKVKAGQSLEEWEKAGWVRPLDPRGWVPVVLPVLPGAPFC
ncbi:hypothetical protein L1887_60182 [Cichorium endivia]|nr:hypothetical protein L1887_60182 [Cichorium endivia]